MAQVSESRTSWGYWETIHLHGDVPGVEASRPTCIQTLNEGITIEHACLVFTTGVSLRDPLPKVVNHVSATQIPQRQ